METVTTLCPNERAFSAEYYAAAVSTRLLRGKPLDIQLSKQDFIIILLQSLGPAQVSSTIVNDIFEQIDADKNGFINGDELTNFLQAKQHARFSEFMYKKLARVSNVGGSMFLCGSSLSILNNLWKRSHETTGGIMLFLSYVLIWLFLIGSALFVGDFIISTRRRLKDEGVKSFVAQLLRKNVRSLGQVVNLMWLWGSLFYVLAIHSKELALSDAASAALWVIGGVSYFLGGFLSIPSIYRKTSARIKQQEEMLRKIQDIIAQRIPVDEEVGFDSNVCSVPKLHVHRRSGSEKMQQSTHRGPSHRRQVTAPVIIHIDLDVDTLSQQELCTTSSLNTLETGSLTCSQDTQSRRTSGFSLESSVSADDIYASLSSDKAIDVDLFLHVLNKMYQNGQIDLSFHEQFVTKTNNLNLYQEIVMSEGFYMAVSYTIAGLLFTIGAIDTGLSTNVVQNMFLSGSCIYFSGGTYCLFKQWQAARNSWHTLQSVAAALENYTLS